MFYDRKKYTLYSGKGNINGVEIEEPLEWETDDKNFIRNETYHGIDINLSDSYTFYGFSKDFIIDEFDRLGVQADVKMVCHVRDDETDLFEVDYVGYIDFESIIIGEDFVKIKFNADADVARFKSKLSANIEIERLTNLDGDPISPIVLSDVYITGRDILKISNLNSGTHLGGNFFWETTERVSALGLEEQGDKENGVWGVYDQIPENEGSGRADINQGYYSECFYGRNETGGDVTLKTQIKINRSNWLAYDKDPGTINFKIRVAIFHFNGFDLIFNREEVLYEYSGNGDDFPARFDLSFNHDVLLHIDESASLQYYINNTSSAVVLYFPAYPLSCPNFVLGWGTPTKVCSFVNEDGEWEAAYDNVTLNVQEDSVRPPSNSKCVNIWEFGNRLSQIALNTSFKSELMLSGDLKDIFLLNGMWLRGLNSDAEKYKPISSSLSDYLLSVNVIYPIGVEISNGQLKIEKRDYFYQMYTSIEVGNVTDLEISVDTSSLFSLVNVGYDKAGGYDEDQGLDEHNRETQYSSILSKNTNIFDLISKMRADGYGLEDVRRDNPQVGINVDINKDSKFDDNIWFIDCELPVNKTSYIISDWTKRFAEPPKNIYSVGSAMNLWLSPINILLRHGKWIKPFLLKYLDSWLRYTSSEGNSKLVTKLIGGNEYAQNIGIPVRDLDNAIGNSMIATFKAPVTWNQLNGTTNGRKNVYGLVKFNSQNVDYKGHIMSVTKKNGIGEFKVKLIS